MDDIIKITIEDRHYTCHRLNPLDGLDFGLKVAALLTSADMSAALLRPEAKEVIRTALDQCYTPENQSLREIVAFNTHFLKFPSDLIVLGFRAVKELAADFFPATLLTSIKQFTAPLKGKA
jgi:hypothetical protein